MSILFATSFGPVVVDLATSEAPLATVNLLKLAKLGCYDGMKVTVADRGFLVEFGDAAEYRHSIWGLLEAAGQRPSASEPRAASSHACPWPSDLVAASNQECSQQSWRHNQPGCVGLITDSYRQVCRLYVTVAPRLSSLDGRHVIVGRVAEGLEYLTRMLELAIVDDHKRPYQDFYIERSHILHDPFEDPPHLAQLAVVGARSAATGSGHRITIDPREALAVESGQESPGRQEARAQMAADISSQILTGLGDLPAADVKPPENVVFVCKLNPLTDEQGLGLLFSQFGRLVSCEIVRERSTGNSLCYAFIEFEQKESAERAVLKMNDVLVDHHRIVVDYSQSVSRMFQNHRSQTKRQRLA
jgi:peptidyl-prolyl cis-trans isomerase-like 4